MAAISRALHGGWFPEAWDVPVALGLGVVITGYIGDTVASFISQWVPANWLNPVSELIIGIGLFMLGGWVGGDVSMWLRLFSFGSFAVGIADSISVLLGLTPAVATVTRVTTAQTRAPIPVRTTATTYR
jgi:hypothetical protein